MLKNSQPYLVLTAFLFSGIVYAEKTEEMPSEEMLEFLMEFDGTDDETFDMMIKNGIKDHETAEIEKVLNQQEEASDVSGHSGARNDWNNHTKRAEKREV